MIASLKNKAGQLSSKLKTQTPLEKNIAEATSNANWGVSNTVLYDICKSSHDFSEYPIIMQNVWAALAERGAKWRRVFKALTLVEFLIKNGAERITDELRDGQFKIRQLTDFYHMEDGQDRGRGIKEKATQILALLNNPEEVRAEREKSKKNREKFMGISSDVNEGFGGRFGGYGSGDPKPYDPGQKYDPNPGDSPPKRSSNSGLASRLERGSNDNRLKDVKIASYTRRSTEEKRSSSRKEKKREPSSSSSSSDSRGGVQTTPNLLDMNFGGQTNTPANNQGFADFEFGNFTAAPQQSQARNSNSNTAFDNGFGDFVNAASGGGNMQQNTGFANFNSSPKARTSAGAMPDFFAASDPFTQAPSVEARSQRNSLTQQMPPAQVQQTTPSFLGDISPQLFDMNNLGGASPSKNVNPAQNNPYGNGGMPSMGMNAMQGSYSQNPQMQMQQQQQQQMQQQRNMMGMNQQQGMNQMQQQQQMQQMQQQQQMQQMQKQQQMQQMQQNQQSQQQLQQQQAAAAARMQAMGGMQGYQNPHQNPQQQQQQMMQQEQMANQQRMSGMQNTPMAGTNTMQAQQMQQARMMQQQQGGQMGMGNQMGMQNQIGMQTQGSGNPFDF